VLRLLLHGGGAIEAIPRLPARLVLVGLSLPDLPCGLQCVRYLQKLRPGLRLVLLVPAGREAALTAPALAAGARECRAAPRNARQCLELLKSAAEGLGPARLSAPLTAREEAILGCRREGYEWKEIREKLQISSHSVVTKLRKRIFKKLGVSGTAAAIRMWEELRGGGQTAT
jgi:DNA-binding NarL/FixJ family response regulator